MWIVGSTGLVWRQFSLGMGSAVGPPATGVEALEGELPPVMAGGNAALAYALACCAGNLRQAKWTEDSECEDCVRTCTRLFGFSAGSYCAKVALKWFYWYALALSLQYPGSLSLVILPAV